MTAPTTVWLSPSAKTFSCLCEPCLEAARVSGASFAGALSTASVRGDLAPDAALAVVHCHAGHVIVLRRVERPPQLVHHDERQLQLA